MPKNDRALDTVVDFFTTADTDTVTAAFQVVQSILRARHIIPRPGRKPKQTEGET